MGYRKGEETTIVKGKHFVGIADGMLVCDLIGWLQKVPKQSIVVSCEECCGGVELEFESEAVQDQTIETAAVVGWNYKEAVAQENAATKDELAEAVAHVAPGQYTHPATGPNIFWQVNGESVESLYKVEPVPVDPAPEPQSRAIAQVGT